MLKFTHRFFYEECWMYLVGPASHLFHTTLSVTFRDQVEKLRKKNDNIMMIRL